MRIVCIGDIGVHNDVIHIGDEAMFEELVVQLHLRGVDDITAISSNPVDSVDRYGVAGIAGIGFPTGPTDPRSRATDRMDAVLRTAAGERDLLDPDDTALGVIEAIRTSDGVAVAGGGNLSSTWPAHIFERCTIGAIAALLGKPLVVTGQTLGPYLTPDDAALVTTLLTSARLVGVREGSSFDLGRKLGVPAAALTHTIDDASFLGIDGAHRIGDAPAMPPYCAVTLAAHIDGADRDEFDRRTAELLDGIAASTELDIVFFAHYGSLRDEVAHGDTVVHERVMARMTAPRVRTHPTTDSVAAARFARNASLVVTCRYHPAVFAVSAGVPTVGIAVDEYTTTKLTGALENFGQDGILPVTELLAGGGPAAVERVWLARTGAPSHDQRPPDAQRAASLAWWDQVALAFRPPG